MKSLKEHKESLFEYENTIRKLQTAKEALKFDCDYTVLVYGPFSSGHLEIPVTAKFCEGVLQRHIDALEAKAEEFERVNKIARPAIV